MQIYHFITHWFIPAPIQRVWQEISEPLNWHQWWFGWKPAERIANGNGSLVGCTIRSSVRGRLPVHLHVTTTIPGAQDPSWMEFDSTGDLVGTGRWELEEVLGGTHVTLAAGVNLRVQPPHKPIFYQIRSSVWNIPTSAWMGRSP